MTLRRGRLNNIQPAGPAKDVAAVKGTVVELVMAIPHKGFESDRSLMTVGVGFGRWCLAHTSDGRFVPGRDLHQNLIDSFLRMEKPEVTAATRRTYASQLRRLARGPSPRPKAVAPTQASAPYSQQVRRRLWTAACNDLRGWMSVEMQTLLALTFGAGCHSEEVVQLRAEDITRVGQRTLVTVVNRDTGQFREVPVYREYGPWLYERSRQMAPQDLLFYASLRSRRNTVSGLIHKATQHANVFEGLRVAAARNTWFCDILRAGVPFPAACQAAGIGPDSKLPTNMLPYLTPPTSTELRRIFDHAFALDEQPAPGCSTQVHDIGRAASRVSAAADGDGDASGGGVQ